MSTEGKRNFRPLIHFTPEQMWMNDPNGMVYVDGEWHLFYQYYPEDTIWGPMHWGHAVSKDLLTWEHLPTALYPDDLGYIFSGSCVYDSKNTSGFGINGKAPIVAMFTSHGAYEQQSIAYSTDGIHFEKYDSNPVIANNQLPDFRDPKVFWNPCRNSWGMVLAAGDRACFYASKNLIEWEKTGEFKSEGEWVKNAVWECPDLFPLMTEEGEKWVLLVSINTPLEDRGSVIYYFIGGFDGDTFTCTQEEMPVILDDGFDHYAGVTFQNSVDRILMGWAVNWLYAAKQPTGCYCGQMTLGRKLSLSNTAKGYRIASKPVTGNRFKTANTQISAKQEAGKATIPGETFLLHIQGKENGSIHLKNKEGQKLIIAVQEDGTIYIDRTQAGAKDFHEAFASSHYSRVSTVRKKTGEFELDIIFDVSILELFADGGLTVITTLIFPDSPYTELECIGVDLTIYT